MSLKIVTSELGDLTIFMISQKLQCHTEKKMATRSVEFSYKGVLYAFVDTQLQSLEDLKCPICLELVSDPVQSSCGHLFCEECIKGIEQCPVCSYDRNSFKTTPDHYNRRRLRSFKVKCPKSEEGCDWQGDLGDAERHTEEKCNYQEVTCPAGCGNKMQCQDLPDHLYSHCPLRDYHCPHCHHRGIFKSVTTSHFTICNDIPLTCPAGCNACIPRKNMAKHLQQSCPMEFVECKYRMLGCAKLIRRNSNAEHLADNEYHLTMAMEAQVMMFSCLRSVFNAQLKTVPDVSLLPISFRPWLQNMPTCYPRPPWVMKMEGFQEEKVMEGQWYSDPVYSHFGGYKMCLKVYANGYAGAKSTHVSVYIYLMQGDNDDNLKWPFKGTIKVSLLNQLEDGEHHTEELWSPNANVPKQTCGRVTRREKAGGGHGTGRLISLQDLNYQGDKNCQYLKDDTLFFRVNCFEPKLD